MEKIKVSKRAARALQGSIKKWDEIVVAFSDPEIDSPEGLDRGIDNCPLCQLYHPRVKADCAWDIPCSPACPIKRDTGQDGCDGTPYEDWCDCSTDDNAQEMLDYLLDLQTRVEIKEK